MNFRGVSAVVLRYLLLYGRNPLRMFELFFWPLIHLVVWGYLSVYLSQNQPENAGLPITFLLGAVLLWDIQFRATQGVSISFLEDVWTRNLLNIFVAPIRTWEVVAGMCAVGLLRVAVTFPILIIIAYFNYQFNIFEFEWALIPFALNLLIFGWGLGILANALILRWGQAAEGLAWALPFMLQPVSAIFYPVDILPPFLQNIALCLPPTHIFEGMRDILQNQTDGFNAHLIWATFLNVVWMIAAGLIMIWVLRIARQRGLLVKVASQ